MTINCKGKILNLDSPIVMGILNVTPDSFYDGGTISNEKEVLSQAKKMLREGAKILDLGGYSSRPGANHIPVEKELKRVIPNIKVILKEFPEAIISIDTFRSEVAKAAINEGASIINDISGGDLDNQMWKVVRELQVPYILMHMRGNPQNMEEKTDYRDVTKSVIKSLAKKCVALKQIGVNDIIVDPGFGFAKTIDQNFELLKNLETLNFLDLPILIGLSRKSMIFNTLNISPKEALNGTTALNMIALQKGANILRVHDVKEAYECITLHNNLTQ